MKKLIITTILLSLFLTGCGGSANDEPSANITSGESGSQANSDNGNLGLVASSEDAGISVETGELPLDPDPDMEIIDPAKDTQTGVALEGSPDMTIEHQVVTPLDDESAEQTDAETAVMPHNGKDGDQILSEPAYTSAVTDLPEALQEITAIMVGNLSTKLGIDATKIAVIQVDEVTWSDSSLGCPQEGMMYLQVMTDGFQIQLEAEEVSYDFHSDSRGQNFINCDPKLSQPPSLSAPTDQ